MNAVPQLQPDFAEAHLPDDYHRLLWVNDIEQAMAFTQDKEAQATCNNAVNVVAFPNHFLTANFQILADFAVRHREATIDKPATVTTHEIIRADNIKT